MSSVRRWLSSAYGAVPRVWPFRRRSRRLHKWRRRRSALVVEVLSYLGTLLLALLVIQAAVVIFKGRALGFIPIDNRCRNNDVSCGVISGILIPLLTIAFVSTAFLFFRLSHVRRGYRREARENPRKLVPTAGSILERVVGRDEFCHVIINNLADRRTRQTYVIVGGVGAGKTAVLVRLTKLLSDVKAIPIPLILRDAQSETSLDFRRLASEKFGSRVSGSLLYEGEGERAWRQLRKDDRIVVLADGLEEALIDNDERNNIIRRAIEDANTQQLPLVIASRPHGPLRNMKAAIIELEPLSEEAALAYMKELGRPGYAEERLDWIIETADVVEEPFYLQITRELHKHGLLKHISTGPEHRGLETRDSDRTKLRLNILDTWINALVDGHFPKGLPMSRAPRETAVGCAAALACIGLKQDTVDVKFADLLGTRPHDTDANADQVARGGQTAGRSANPPVAAGGRVTEAIGVEGRVINLRELAPEEPHPVITKLVKDRFNGLGPDIQVAATWAEQLGLVEVRGASVRFPHSILQAYLGSHMMEAALRDDKYCREAAQRPGREFLISVVMFFSFGKPRQPITSSGGGLQKIGNSRSPASWDDDVVFIIDLLRRSAKVQDVEAKRLDIYAAALEIDSANRGLQHKVIADLICANWPETTITYDRPLEEAKLGLIHRFGEAVRKVAKLTKKDESARPADGDSPASADLVPAYKQLYQIGICEKSYPVRLAIALEIGSGGDDAYDCLKEEFVRVRDSLGKSGEDTERAPDEKLRKEWREKVLCAWLAPLLVGSVSGRHTTYVNSDDGNTPKPADESPRSILNGWLRHLGEDVRSGKSRPLPVSLEIALAQGFKYAANRRSGHPAARQETRDWLAEEATEMLKRSRFWFTHLTLLHALCLWTLRSEEDEVPSRGSHGSQPEAIAQQWLSIAGSKNAEGAAGRVEHPFVEEAGRLVALALKEQAPEKYIWIDESGVTGIIGSHAPGPRARRKHNLWLPPSTGWSVLDPRAQRLVADVLLLLNLAERGDRPEDHDRRLGFTDRTELPLCLTMDRSFLDLGRPIGAAGSGAPGSNCKDDCRIRLCPYPPWGGTLYRVELSEPFCRYQEATLRRFGQGTARWQKMAPKNLRKSWRQMAERSRGAYRPDRKG